MIREMLKRHEGLILKKYRCPGGFWTIGYGWNLDAHKLPDDIATYLRMNGKITEDMAETLLNISLTNAQDDCYDIYPGFIGFSDARKDALIDFVFNVGSTTAMKFVKMRDAIESGNWQRAADEMYYSKWREQVGGRADELIEMMREG
jgi:lysozyme